MSDNTIAITPSETASAVYTAVSKIRVRSNNLARAVVRIVTKAPAIEGATKATVVQYEHAEGNDSTGSYRTATVLVKLATTPGQGVDNETRNAKRRQAAQEIADTCGASIEIIDHADTNEVEWRLKLPRWHSGQNISYELTMRLRDSILYSPIPVEVGGRERRRTAFPGHEILAEKEIDGDRYYLCSTHGAYARHSDLGVILADGWPTPAGRLPAAEGRDPKTNEKTVVGVMIETSPDNPLTELGSETEPATTPIIEAAREFFSTEITKLAQEPKGFLTVSWAQHQELLAGGATLPENPGPLTRWPGTGPKAAYSLTLYANKHQELAVKSIDPALISLEHPGVMVLEANLDEPAVETLARAIRREPILEAREIITLVSADPQLVGYSAYDRLPRVTELTMVEEIRENGAKPEAYDARWSWNSDTGVELSAKRSRATPENRQLRVDVKMEDRSNRSHWTIGIETDVLLPIPRSHKSQAEGQPLCGAIIDRERLTASADELATMLRRAYGTEPTEDGSDAEEHGLRRLQEDHEREWLRQTAASLEGEDQARLRAIEDAARRHAGPDLKEGETVTVTIRKNGGQTTASAHRT